MKPILEVQQISKRYSIDHQAESYLSIRDKITHSFHSIKTKKEDFWALDNVSFDVYPGESIGIIGKNGAGKSTLLKILSKITPPTSGKAIARGRIASLLEVGTGFHSELSGRENIFLNGSILGMKRREIQLHFDEIVSFSGVDKFLDTPLKHYSSGMQLRLAFAVAAFLEPEIMVIDEVLAVGDAEFQKKCLGKMEEVTSQGRTILFVSHNMAAVEHLCTRGVLLKSGKVLHTGKIDEVVELYLKTEKVQAAPDERGLPLANGVFVKEFLLSHDKVNTLGDLEYSLTIESSANNRISDLVVLIYNHLNERVGIIDLRHRDLGTRSLQSNRITVRGKINKLPLIEGIYSLGLYVSSALCQGDYLNLKRLEVLSVQGEFVPYALKYRGYTEFDATFTVL
jgi:lipopolysaccharide transport system ATP-binding protein